MACGVRIDTGRDAEIQQRTALTCKNADKGMFDDEFIALNIQQEADVFLRTELAKSSPSNRRRVIEKFVLAALGSIPWIGGFLSSAATLKTEQGARRTDSLHTQWLEEHARKLASLRVTLETIVQRFESLGPAIDERIQSEEYLQLVRHAFHVWDEASTEEKRRYVGNVVANASGTRLCADDVIRLFLDWLNLYHESHFAVIRCIHNKQSITRFEVWDEIYGELPREDSPEADLFKLLIRDLSTGGVIRQERDTNQAGQFLRKRRPRSKVAASTTMESAFEDTKPYVLTGLGDQFVHYTMNEVVTRIGAGTNAGGQTWGFQG
ncbi:MAG TPA: hypothetical protein VEU96_03990 [Bryobacteraceae bacterium]|nr:hypothetical protein [Bryobacteraceae bacterium]